MHIVAVLLFTVIKANKTKPLKIKESLTILPPTTMERQTMKQNQFPPGWGEERGQSVIDYYENQTEDEAVAEHEAASQNEFGMLIEVIEVLVELGPAVCEWILDALVDSQ